MAVAETAAFVLSHGTSSAATKAASAGVDAAKAKKAATTFEQIKDAVASAELVQEFKKLKNQVDDWFKANFGNYVDLDGQGYSTVK